MPAAPLAAAATLAAVEAERAAAGTLYRQFLSCGSLSVGLYVLEAGAVDPQSPHEEDEVYQIVSGRAVLSAGDEEIPVGPGSVVFVAKHVDHRFHSVSERLEVVVFFAPEHAAGR